MSDKREKPKTRAEILAEQNKAREEKEEKPSSEKADNKIEQSKEAKEIAENKQKEREAEIKIEVMEKGYKSIEDALKDIANKEAEAEKLYETAQQVEKEAQSKLDDILSQEEELNERIEQLENREKATEGKLERVVAIEKQAKEHVEAFSILKEEIEQLIDYHNEHISPCVESLSHVSKAIYTWVEPLNEYTDYDFSPLYQYICRVTGKLEGYLNTIPKFIDKDKLK